MLSNVFSEMNSFASKFKFHCSFVAMAPCRTGEKLVTLICDAISNH